VSLPSRDAQSKEIEQSLIDHRELSKAIALEIEQAERLVSEAQENVRVAQAQVTSAEYQQAMQELGSVAPLVEKAWLLYSKVVGESLSSRFNYEHWLAEKAFLLGGHEEEQPQGPGRFLLLLIALDEAYAEVEMVGKAGRFSEVFGGCSGRGRLSLALRP
jgi:hypothetical protein